MDAAELSMKLALLRRVDRVVSDVAMALKRMDAPGSRGSLHDIFDAMGPESCECFAEEWEAREALLKARRHLDALADGIRRL